MAELRRAREQRNDLPRILFFTLADEEATRAFFAERWPEARAISDPEGHLRDAFAIPRGGLRQMFGLRVWAAGFRAVRRGHGIGKPAGDVWRMPGAVLVANEHVVWTQSCEHAGTQPDLEGAIAAAQEHAASAAAPREDEAPAA